MARRRRRRPGIIDGKPGTTFTNETGRTLYQFFASLINTCGFCLQYHRKIADHWPIPLHVHCRCIQVPIPPGEKAEGRFLDYAKLYKRLKAADRATAVGSANAKLIKAGLVTVDDVVIPERVRTLAEVVKAKRLSIKSMVKAGVPTATAKKAYETAHQSAKILEEQARRKLIFDLEPATRSQQDLADALAKTRASAQVTIDVGRNYAERLKRGLDERSKAVGKARAAVAPKVKAVMKPVSRPVPVPEPKPAAFQSVLDDALKALPSGDDADKRRIRRKAIAVAVGTHSTMGPEGAFHGMTQAEKFRTLQYQGMAWHYPETMTVDAYHPLVMEIEEMERRGHPIPARLAESTRDVYYTAQRNNADATWAERFNMPDFRTDATGEDGTIVAYHGDPLGVRTLSHEMGHNLAQDIYGTAAPKRDYEAILDLVFNDYSNHEKAVTEYARKNAAEDFAETIAEYVDDPANLRAKAPKRFAVVDRIMKDRGYGG